MVRVMARLGSVLLFVEVVAAFSSLVGCMRLPVLPAQCYRRPSTSKMGMGMGMGARMVMKGGAAHSDVEAATQAWVNEWVIGLNLCPWAKLTRGTVPRGEPYTRVLVLHGEGEGDVEEHAMAVFREAEALRQRAGGGGDGGFFTTLLVFPDTSYLGQGPEGRNCGMFPALVRNVQSLLAQEEGRRERVDLLAFHRWRVDQGPGTSESPEDAAHFPVRSPYPTLQLLLENDLGWARGQWQQQQQQQQQHLRAQKKLSPGSPHSSLALPGALGLLVDNKERLRRRGSAALTSLMDSFLQIGR